MLKPPRTSLRAGRDTLEDGLVTAQVRHVSRCCLLGEVTAEVKSATHRLQCLEAINDLQLSVVGDLVSTANGLQHRERDVG